MVDFVLCVTGDDPDWVVTSQIFIDKKGKSPTPETLRNTKSKDYATHTDLFEDLLR